jgi:hypothetical protein
MDRPVGYQVRIRVAGQLPPTWSDVLGDLAVAADPDGTTLLHGEVPDQAALHGLLDAIRDLGLALISVDIVAGRRPSMPMGG